MFCYLTPAGDPDTSEAVSAGRKVLVDGGDITKTGTFPQPLSDDVDVEAVSGVAIWCADFSVPFGAATLRAV